MSWTDIPGWCDFTDIYAEAIQTAPKDAILVEIGTAFGRSIAFLAGEAIRCNRPDLRIFCIDPWIDDHDADWIKNGSREENRPTWGAEHAEWARAQGGPFSAFIEKMRTHAPAELERINVIRGYSVAASGMFRYQTVHMAFIDGSHRYADVKNDIVSWGALVPASGILAGHDFTPEFPGVLQAVNESFPGMYTQQGTSWRRTGSGIVVAGT